MMTTPEGVEHTRGDSGSVSTLQSSPAVACKLSVSVFLISASCHPEIAIGALFIEGFRSRLIHRHKNGRHRTLEAETKGWGMARYPGRAMGPSFQPIDLLLAHLILLSAYRNFRNVASDLALFRVS